MARPERNNVDYFPHPVKHGKKMFFIRKKYGNDGYTVWNMLLEFLGDANNHYLDLNDETELMYLYSEFDVSEDTLNNIIADLVKFGEFDKELWEEERILFNQKFIDSIQDAYQRRRNKCIDRNTLIQLLITKGRLKPGKFIHIPVTKPTNGHSNPQRIGKDRIGEEIKEKNISLREKFFNEVLEIFYFKNWKDPWTVAGSFFDHYSKAGWVDANKNEVKDVLAAARSWNNLSTQGKNSAESVLKNWQIAFNLIKSKSPDYWLFLYTRIKFRMSAQTTVIEINETTRESINANKALLAVFADSFKVAFTSKQKYSVEVNTEIIPAPATEQPSPSIPQPINS